MRDTTGVKTKDGRSSRALLRACRRPCVDQLPTVVHDPLDCPLLLQMPDGDTSQTSIDFQPLDEDALADESEGGNFLHYTVVGGLVKNDGMLGLILDLSLRPLFFLCGFATARGGGCFASCFGHVKKA